MDFSVTYSFRPFHGLGVDSASSENEYQEHLLGARAAGAWGWRPHHIHVSNIMKIWESKSLGTLWDTPGLLRDCFTFNIHKEKYYHTDTTMKSLGLINCNCSFYCRHCPWQPRILQWCTVTAVEMQVYSHSQMVFSLRYTCFNFRILLLLTYTAILSTDDQFPNKVVYIRWSRLCDVDW